MALTPQTRQPLPGDSARFKQARLLLRGMVTQSMDFASATFDDTITRLRKHLFELADHSESSVRASHWLSAYNLLGRQGEVFKRSFLNSLRATLDEQAEAPLRPRSESLLAAGGLSLVDTAEQDRAVLLDRVSRPINAFYEEEVAPLTHRCGVLFGDDDPQLARNPVRPEVFLRAFMQGWEMAGLDSHATEDLLLSITPQTFFPLDVLYDALDRTLVKAGVAPKLQLRVRKARDTGVMPPSAFRQTQGGPSDDAKTMLWRQLNEEQQANLDSRDWGGAGFQDSILRIGQSAKEFLGKLSNMLRRPLFTGDSESAAALLPQPDPQFVGFLNSLQARALDEPQPIVVGDVDEVPVPENMLRAMAESDRVKEAAELDRGTVEVLAQVFDYVFSEISIPSQLKVVISRLQIPVLKAAMIDREFFFKQEHPARKLVDSLARASVAWAPEKGEDDPLYAQIEKTVQRVLSDFQEDLSLFTELLEEFERFLFESEQQVAARIEPQANDAATNEQFELALRTADECVHSRMAGREIDALLTPFLTNQWREVLAHAWLNRERRPDVWDRAVETMDQLIWSVKPKATPEDRRQLVSVLPTMVRHINVALDAIRWTGDERAAFTKRLIETHTRVVRAGVAETPADPMLQQAEEAAASSAREALEARRANVNGSLEDQYDEQAHGLSRNTWFDFIADDGSERRYRLSWVSPMRTRLLFTNREGFDAFVHSERDVARLLRTGRLRPVDVEPIVARALGALLGEDAGDILNGSAQAGGPAAAR